MEGEDLHDILFSSASGPGIFQQQNSKYQTPQTQLYTSTLSNNFHSNQLPPKSENKTREDLEELIGEIPFPNDLSLTSFASSISNTPQKYNHHYNNRLPPGTSEDRKSGNLKSAMKSNPKQAFPFSSGKRASSADHFGSASQNRPHNLDFNSENHVIFEVNPTQESFTPNNLSKIVDWSKRHITPMSNNIFPDVVAPTMEMSADGSLMQSKNTHERLDFSKSPIDIHDNTIDHIHEKEPASDSKQFQGKGYQAAGDSRARIEIKRLQDQLVVTENELNFQKKKYNNLEQENNYLSQRINELEEHAHFLQEKYNNNTPLESLRGQNLSNAKMQLKQVKTILEKKDEKVSELIGQIQQMRKNDQLYREAVDNELNNLHLEIERAKILSQSHQNRANELENKLKENFEHNLINAQKKDNQKDDLLRQIDQQHNEIQAKNSDIQKKKATIEKLASSLQERDDLLNEASDKLAEKEKEVELLKKQNENFLMDQHKLTNLESDKVWEQKYSQLEEEFNRVKQIKDREIANLRGNLTQEKDRIKALEEIQRQMEGRRGANALDALLELERKEANDDEMNKMRSQYEKEIQSYHSKIEDLTKKINYLENERAYGSNTQTSKSSMGANKGEKLTVSQSINCTLYIELLEDLMSSLNIFMTPDGDFEENIRQAYENVNELKVKIQDLEKTVVEFRKRQISINSDLDCTKMENEQLIETLKERQAKDVDNAEKLMNLHNEISDLKRTIISLESQQGRSGGFTERSEDQNYQQDYLQIKEDYKSLETEYTNAKETIQKLQIKCQGMELELKRNTSQLQRSKDEIELLKLEIETKSSSDKNHWESMKKSFTDKIKALEQKNENLMEEIRKKEIENAELKGKLEALNNDLRNNGKSNAHIVEENNGRVQHLEKRNKELQGELMNKEDELDQLKMKLREVEFDLEQERSDNNDLTRKSHHKSEHLEDEILNLREENANFIEQINRLNEIIERRDLELNKHINEKNALKSENERLNLSLDQEKSREDVVRKLNDNLSEKERQLEALRNALKDKENEVKYIVESARKKEVFETKSLNDLDIKSKELEKVQNNCHKLDKEIDALRKEKVDLGKNIESMRISLEKTEQELKKKDETIKQLQDTTKRNNKDLQDKNKANLDQFNINKTLKENLKTLEETHANLNTEYEQKVKALNQKTSELKKLSQANKTLEENNQELSNEVNQLKTKVQQLESEISNKKAEQQPLKERNLNQSENLSHSTERKTTVDSERPRGFENTNDSKIKPNIEKLLQSFAERESEFENIKHSFVEKIMSMNEKLAQSEQKCSSLLEENNYLNTQIGLYENANSLLNDKIKTLEASMKLMNQWSLDESMDPLQKMETRGDPLSSLRKTRSGIEDFEGTYDMYKNIDIDELRPPSNYEANPLKSMGNKGLEFEMRSTMNAYDEKAVTNCFANNIIDMISPEMLSTEDTVSLMLEMMRRASQSHKLAVTLGRNYEFKELSNSIRKHCILEEQSENGYGGYGENMMNSTATGKIRRQYSIHEPLSAKY